uniref:Uncharacterized protein n=1 Tax=Arundo donax TaxID=35708 RepID=A0A0A9AQY4_ARUDO
MLLQNVSCNALFLVLRLPTLLSQTNNVLLPLFCLSQ